MTLQDKLQASVKALDELSNNKRLAATTRLALLEASDNIVAANAALDEFMEALRGAAPDYPPWDTIHALLAKHTGEQP